MISIRSFARSAPRNISRITASAVRTPAARSTCLSQSVWKPAQTKYAALFSTSSMRRAKDNEADAELIAKLEAEIQMENEMKEEEGVPTSVKDYLENGPFTITDTPGEEEVVLTRTYGDEKIQVTFSIADLNAIDPEADYQDSALGDEQDPNAEQKDEMDDGEGNDDQPETPFLARLNIIVEKPSKGALAVEAIVQEGAVVIDNVYFYTDASHAYAKTAEAVHKRQDLYVGPPFGNLDEDLQVLMERYLDERGINTALAIFVPDYIDTKEQKEYMRWLENVKGFVAA